MSLNHQEDLKILAKSHIQDNLNTWPQHNQKHVQGSFLFDYYCLRCWLEKLAAEECKNRRG